MFWNVLQYYVRVFTLGLKQSSCGVLKLTEAGAVRRQVAAFPPCSPLAGRYPGWFCAEVSLTQPEHASHSSSATPRSYFGQWNGMAAFFFSCWICVGIWGDRTPSLLLWRTLLLGLYLPGETGAQNHLDWERLAEITWPHGKTLTWNPSISTSRTRVLIGKSHQTHCSCIPSLFFLKQRHTMPVSRKRSLT